MKLSELCKYLDSHGFSSECDGVGDPAIESVNTIEDAQSGDITFLANPKYSAAVATTKASAIIVKPGVEVPDSVATLRCSDPYGAITAAIIKIHGYREHPQWGIHERAVISTGARIGSNANIGPYVTVADGVVIGDSATIYPGCHIADDVRLGDQVTLFPNVVIYDGAHIGNRVTIHAGSVIGEDGLGYAPVDGAWLKIPQIGSIVVEDDVEIGACCAMDRATVGETRIGRGSKFSNSVVIGHGTKVGEHCMIVAQVGVAGSARIGNNVTLAGQVGINGHLTIGDGARVGAQSGVQSNIEGGTDYLGSPAVESSAFRRQSSLVNRLPQMKQRLRDLEAEVQRLRESVEEHVEHGQ